MKPSSRDADSDPAPPAGQTARPLSGSARVGQPPVAECHLRADGRERPGDAHRTEREQVEVADGHCQLLIEIGSRYLTQIPMLERDFTGGSEENSVAVAGGRVLWL